MEMKHIYILKTEFKKLIFKQKNKINSKQLTEMNLMGFFVARQFGEIPVTSFNKFTVDNRVSVNLA